MPSGWWLGHPSEKYDFVNWDDEIPNISGKIKLMATKPPTSSYFMTQQDHFRMTLSCQRSSILVGFSLINHLILGIPHFGKHPYNNRFAWERHNRSPMWSTVTRSSRTGAEKSTEIVQRNPLTPSTWGETWGDHYITVDVNKDRCIYVAKPRHLPYVFIYIYTYIYIYTKK